jgi:hypothetical protein
MMCAVCTLGCREAAPYCSLSKRRACGDGDSKSAKQRPPERLNQSQGRGDPESTSDLNAHSAIPYMRVVCYYGPLGPGLFSTPSGQISIAIGRFSNPAAIRHLPVVVIRSLPCRSTMYPSSINRARCSAGMAAGGSRTAHVLPTVRREANSSGVRDSDSDAMIILCPLTCIGMWSNLLMLANTASEQFSAQRARQRAIPGKAACFRPPMASFEMSTCHIRLIVACIWNAIPSGRLDSLAKGTSHADSLWHQ